MRTSSRRLVLWVHAGALTLLLSGCGAISSLQFDNRLMVKIPTSTHIDEECHGWDFRHVAEGPAQDGNPVGQWYLAWKVGEPSKPHLSFPWSRWVYARHHALDVVDASFGAFGAYPTMIEPDFVFTRAVTRVEPEAPVKGSPSDDSADKPSSLQVRELPYASWPNPTKNGELVVGWHLDSDHTQLNDAVKQINGHHGESAIRIGILDNGFSAEQAGVPERSHLVDQARGDAMGRLITDDGYQPQSPGSTGASHGTGTIGILAGRRVEISATTIKGQKIARFEGYLGGDPRATIVPVRIAPWVFSVTTANMAYGIDYASRVQKCDVLTMSHGGSPCQVWVDAVNAAYERGTAMFAAEGDFYSVLPEPVQPRGIIIPSGPVYPAAFRTVMGVTGVTSSGNSYAENTLSSFLAHPFAFDWLARGSYGPKGSWRTPFGENEKPDSRTVKYQGLLRAYPIAAYSPNIPWLVAPTQEDPRTNLVDLNGSGTSAATPQVAAAAALWLDYHHDELSPNQWRSWEKAEAVYTALLLAAYQSPDKTWPDRYLGAGILKANKAIGYSFQNVKNLVNEPRRNPDGTIALTFSKAPRDYFDGTRSIGSLFGLADDDVVYFRRADLDQTAIPHITREAALARVFYNTLLLQKWHAGHLPEGVKISEHFHQSLEIKDEATQLAQHYLQTDH